MDIFEQLLVATNSIKNPRRTVKVLGVKNSTCIRGLKRAELVCADGVNRVIMYRGALADAVPNSTITLIDISDDIQ